MTKMAMICFGVEVRISKAADAAEIITDLVAALHNMLIANLDVGGR
jgi:hypothetical protein